MDFLSQVPARVALAVTTLLAMSTTMASIQKSLPPVAYTKAKLRGESPNKIIINSRLLMFGLVFVFSLSLVPFWSMLWSTMLPG